MEGRATSPRRGTGDATRQRNLSAPLLEVFASIQGEGHHVGEPQVFLRLAGCPLRCAWCDTPAALEVPNGSNEDGVTRRRARVHPAGAERADRRVEEHDAWATPFRAAVWIAQADPEARRAVMDDLPSRAELLTKRRGGRAKRLGG